jgi:hypothetical protein
VIGITLLQPRFIITDLHSGDGAEMAFTDEPSGIVVAVPLPQDSVAIIADKLAEFMTPEQKRELARKLTGGIVLPGS